MWIGITGEDTLYEFVIILLILNRDESKGTILYKGCLLIYFIDGLYIIQITDLLSCHYVIIVFIFCVRFHQTLDKFGAISVSYSDILNSLNF